MGCPQLSDDKQPAAVNDSAGIFGTFFTLRWLRAHRIIISQLCCVSQYTGHASVLLWEISKEFICETGISKCLWGKGLLTPNMTDAGVLLTLVSWFLFSEVLSVNFGQAVALWQGMIGNFTYCRVSKESWHIFMWKASVLLRMCFNIGKGKGHGGVVLEISVLSEVLFSVSYVCGPHHGSWINRLSKQWQCQSQKEHGSSLLRMHFVK